MIWYKNNNSDIVVSTRIRLARNVDKTPFPNALKDTKEVTEKIKNAVLGGNSTLAKDFDFIDLDNTPLIRKQELAEEHLISPVMCEGKGKSVMISKDRTMSIMLMEEDHIRLQIIKDGFALDEAYSLASKVDDVIGVVLADAGRERLLSDPLVLVGHAVLPAPELELQPVPEPQFPGPLLHQMIPLVLVRRQAPEGKPEGQPGKELFLGVGFVQPPQEIVLVRRAELLCLPPVPHCFLHFVHGNTSFFCITQRCFVTQSVTPFGCVVNEYVPAIFRAENAKKEGENKKSPRSPERRAGNLSFYPACRASFFASR